jgi:glycerophosphoryl diester phosphodiesterase
MTTKITAHRGFTEEFPENTIEAFKGAVERSADRIEFDVHMTRDKHFVIHHDYYLGKTDNGEGLIYEKNLKYLQTLDVGSWYGSKFAHIKIPTLEQVFETFQNTIEYEIEIKGFTVEFLQSLLDLVGKYNVLNHVEFTTNPNYLIYTLKKMRPEVKTGVFLTNYPSWMTPNLGEKIILENLTLGKVNVAHCPIAILNEEFIVKLRNRGISVHAADCDKAEDLTKAYQLGVDQLSTNKLTLALELRKDYE